MLINSFQRIKRIPEIELLKFIAIVSMVFVHTAELASDNIMFDSESTVIFFVILSFLGGIPAAGVFMFAMGWGAAFSKRSTPQTYLERFLLLFVLGIVVNFFEQYVPSIISPEIFNPLEEKFPSILATDIYFFAALTSLYFVFMKSFEGQPKYTITFSVILAAVCIAVRLIFGFENFSTENIWLDMFIGLFVRENEWSYFPFTVWIIFPMLGYGAANLYKNRWSQKEVIIFSAVTGIISVVVAKFAMKNFGVIDGVLFSTMDMDIGNYYSMHPLNTLCSYGIIALEFLAATLFVQFMNGSVPKIIENVSRNVMQIYVIQWILIGCLSKYIYNISNVTTYTASAIGILILSCIFAEVVKKFTNIRI